MSDHIEAARAAVRRDVERIYTDEELVEARIAYGSCQTCGAARISKMTEPEPDSFLLSMVCSANESHEA